MTNPSEFQSPDGELVEKVARALYCSHNGHRKAEPSRLVLDAWEPVAEAAIETARPLIQQQVLREVIGDLRRVAESKDTPYVCQGTLIATANRLAANALEDGIDL